MGLVISQSNPDLLKLIRPLFNATPISSVSDALFARVLQDEPFVEKFLADNRAALAAAYEFVAEWLIFHNLKCVPFHALVEMRFIPNAGQIHARERRCVRRRGFRAFPRAHMPAFCLPNREARYGRRCAHPRGGLHRTSIFSSSLSDPHYYFGRLRRNQPT